MLRILYGTDWISNRDAILQRIAGDVRMQQGGRILLVPELISHETERRLARVAGDTASRYAEVLSFSRLTRLVSETLQCGVAPCLDQGGRIIAMAAAVRQLHSRLKAYAKVETNPEFLSGLVDAVDEFKRCCISAEDLKAAAAESQGTLAQKLEELSLILEAYDTICQLGKRDPRDQMSWILEKMEESDFGKDRCIYIDGFPDFTRQNFAVIAHFIRVCPSVTIALNIDRIGSGAVAFEKAGQTAEDLVRYAKDAGIPVECEIIPERQDLLIEMRRGLIEGHIAEVSRLTVTHAESVQQECFYAAEKIMDLVRGGARYRDCAVVCTDMESYRAVAEMVFRRCKIPVYLSGTEQILDKSVVSTVLAAMDAALNGFERRDMLRYIRSGLSPLDQDTADELENYVITWGITGKTWLREWDAHPDGLSGVWDLISQDCLSKLNAARARIMQPLEQFQSSFSAAANLQQQVKTLYDFLTQIDIAGRLDLIAQELIAQGDLRNAQILNQLWEIILSAMEQMHDVLGTTVWDCDTFTRLFQLLLCQYDVGTIPTVLDAVTIGPISSMRCHQTKHLFILGAEEGMLPHYGAVSGVLSDQERTELRRLGVPLTGGAMDGLQTEFSEIYGVFCSAEKTVCVSFSGDQPSFIYRRVAQMTAGEDYAQDLLGPALADPLEAGAFLASSRLEDVACKLNLKEYYEHILSRCSYSLGKVDTDRIKDIYGKKLHLSASQIDRQAECRLSYFLKYGLRAKERKEASVDPAEFGTYVHAVLEGTAADVMAHGGFHQVDLSQTLAFAKAHSERYAEEHFLQLDSQRLNHLFQRNAQELDMVVQELWEELHQSEYEPAGFEVAFGNGQALDAIDISGSKMEAVLRGFVDRVDRWGDYFRVVDYKTGKKDFDYCDVFNGVGLQMLLYLFALARSGDALVGTKSIPAGVQYFPARAPYIPGGGKLTDEEADKLRRKEWKRRGLLLRDEASLQAMEPDPSAQRLCATRRKDGTLTGDLADRDQMRILETYLYRLLGNMVDDIASGNVEPNPYTRGSSHSACAFCPYGAICHKTQVEHRRNYKAMSAERFWEEVEKEVNRHG